jgi:chromosome segregation ATPase
MSIFNPWGEIRRLKAQLEAGYETYRIEETQQQADWAKKGARLIELERENADLLCELAVLSDPAKKISKLESNLKRRAGVVERRNNEIKSLKRMLRELREKYQTTFAVHGEAANNMGKLKILCTNLKVENYELKKKEARLLELERENADLRRNRQALNARILQLLNQLDTAVLRDPKTGRLLPRKGN